MYSASSIDSAQQTAVGPAVNVVRCSPGIPNLAPMIVRERLVIEGTCPAPISEEQVIRYLERLSGVCEMECLSKPVTHLAPSYGWAGWIHWEDSGAHFYAWEVPILFFSADIYTCKSFDAERACEFTKSFFDATEIVALSF
jgi:hypothetical protein